MKTRIKILLGAANVAAVSGFIRICGLEDRIYFNKSFLSAALFLLTIALAGRTWEELSRDKRRGRTAFFLSWLLIFTELLGGSLRLLENHGGVMITVWSVLWMLGSAFFLSWLLEPAFYRLLGISWREKKEFRQTGNEQIEERRPERGQIEERQPGRGQIEERQPGRRQTEERQAGKGQARGKHRVTAPGSARELNRIFLLSWLVLFLGWIPCFLAFYPGLYCYDMIWQWSMFESGVYSTHHPLLHTLFAGGLIRLGKEIGGSWEAGFALHSLVQMAILSGCMAFALRYLAKIRAPRVLFLGCGAFYLLFPFFPVSAVSTTKDVIFGGLMLVVFVCLWEMAAGRALYRGWRLAAFIAAAVLMGLFRNNAVYGLAFLAACLFCAAAAGRLKRRANSFAWRMGLLLAVVIVGIQGGFWGLEKGLQAQKGSIAEMCSLPMQQLARTYVYHQEEISDEDKELLFSYLPEENLLRYKYYVSDPVKAGFNQEYFAEHTGDFVRLWLKLGLQHPKEYLLSPLYNMMGLWYLGGDSSCFVAYEMDEPFDQEHVVEAAGKLPWLKEAYTWFTDENLQKYLPGVCIFFYTSFYVWAVLVSGAYLFASKQYACLAPVLFLGGYILTLVLGPCVTVRYLLGVMMAVPVLAVCGTLDSGNNAGISRVK